MCNESGTIEADLTIARLAEEHFYIVTGTALVGHDLDWITRNALGEHSVVAYDVSSSRGVLNLAGPLAREVFEEVTDADVSHEGFPFGTCKELFIGSAPALALRVSYHGELGWELHVPIEYLPYVYEALMAAGAEHGIANIGYRALESCRLEKGYYVWGRDITTDYTPFEARLGFNVHLKSGGDFIGREALEAEKESGSKETMCLFTIDEEVALHGSEPILSGGEVIGIVTSGGIGHSVKKTIALGYLPVERLEESSYAIAAFGEEHAAQRLTASPYDPDRARILC
jgi:4-methylaminobutanoate oxidase (formaldehyde-forming)